MAVTYRVCVPRKNEKTGKTFWRQIGSAWKRDTGAMSVKLDALPIGDEFMIFPPDEGAQRGQSQQKADDDDISY